MSPAVRIPGAAVAALVAAAACIDLETAYQDCLDEGRCAEADGDAGSGGGDAGHPPEDSGTTIADSGYGGGDDAGGTVGADGGALTDAGQPTACLCTPGTFCTLQVPTTVFGQQFYSAFAARPNEVWIGGGANETYRYADGGWQPLGAGGVATGYVGHVSGPSADEVWEFSLSNWFARRWTPANRWQAFPNEAGFKGPFTGYARVPGLVLAYATNASDTRVIQRLSADGGAWITELSDFNYVVEAFCGDAPDTLKIVGGGPRIHHRRADGGWESDSCTSCSHFNRTCWTAKDGTAIGGSSGPGGWTGVLDGGAIEEMQSFADAGVSEIYGLWGTSVRNDLWAVGDTGAILRRVNGTWTRHDAGVTSNLLNVTGHVSDAGLYEVWVVGEMDEAVYYCE